MPALFCWGSEEWEFEVLHENIIMNEVQEILLLDITILRGETLQYLFTTPSFLALLLSWYLLF